MDDHLFQIGLAIMLFLMGAVQFLVGQRLKEQIIWMRNLDGDQKENTKTLVRIETRLESLDELRKKQEHDHRELRDMSKEVDRLDGRVKSLEKSLTGIVAFCQKEHGNHLEPH